MRLVTMEDCTRFVRYMHNLMRKDGQRVIIQTTNDIPFLQVPTAMSGQHIYVSIEPELRTAIEEHHLVHDLTP